MTNKLSQPALLLTESKEDYQALQKNLEHEILPRNFVEGMYVADIVALTWEILRLRRCKAGIINAAFGRALQILLEPYFGIFDTDGAKNLAQRWFTDPRARKEVAEILRKVRLDEFAVEAEGVRLSLSDLELVDRMMSAFESRRNKALRNIEDYRVGFAKQVRDGSDRVLKGKVPALVSRQ
jgi:hypothetical protein